MGLDNENTAPVAAASGQITIENSTIGANADGIEECLSDIKEGLIDKASEEIDTNISTLKSNIKSYWQGEAANEFDKSLDEEFKKLKDYLANLKEKMERDLRTMAANIGQADKNAADAIKALYK